MSDPGSRATRGRHPGSDADDDEPGGGTVIASEAELLACLGLDDIYQLGNWIDACLYDPVAWFDVQAYAHEIEVVCVGYHLEQDSIALIYPFTLDDLHREAARVADHFWQHQKADALGTYPLGIVDEAAAELAERLNLEVDDTNDDDTGQLADLLDVEVDDIVEILEGCWLPVEGLPRSSSGGHDIYAWFIRASDPVVALGVGGEALYVERAHLAGPAEPGTSEGIAEARVAPEPVLEVRIDSEQPSEAVELLWTLPEDTDPRTWLVEFAKTVRDRSR